MRERCLCILGSVCGTFRHLKISLCRVVGSIVMSFFLWSDTSQHWWSGLLYVRLSFLLFFLFSLLPKKLQFDPFCCSYFNFSPYFFIFYFYSWFICRNFICFQFHSSIPIYQILYFSIWFLFFWFAIFFLCCFVKVSLIFNFIFQSELIVLYFSI